jgi:adenylate kinase family enzyme
MRVAIIGYSGAGKTTVAKALAGIFGSKPIDALDELLERLDADAPLVLDGIPRTVEELNEIDAKAPDGRGVTHVLYLLASSEIRLERMARMVTAGADPAQARDRMLRPADLKELRDFADNDGRVTVIDATRTRSEVLSSVLTAIGIRI